MKKSILNIIEKYNLKDDLEHIFGIENPDNDPDLPPEYKRKKDFVYSSLKYIPKIIDEIKTKTGIKLNNPSISPFEEDSLDFSWKTNEYSLLANVSKNSGVSYYMMDSKQKELAKGSL